MRSKRKEEMRDTREEKKIRERKKKVLTKGWVVWIIFLLVRFYFLQASGICYHVLCAALVDHKQWMHNIKKST
jgi:hypothetical protein